MEHPRDRQGKPRIRERGQGLVEYALVLILVAVVVILILSFFGDRVQKTYCKAAFSLDPNIDAPFCEALSVSCNVVSASPFRLEAQVTDNAGEDNITNVQFYIDGIASNNELHYRYCLVGGDASCDAYHGSSGPHEFAAVAYDSDGNTGKCTIHVTIP
jgi:Flp pilus assembly pilin Flp